MNEGQRSNGRRGRRPLARLALSLASVVLALLVTLPACIFGGQTGQNASDETPRCEDSRRAVDDREIAGSLELSAEQAAQRFGGRRMLTFSWTERGRTLQAELTVSYAGGQATWVRNPACEDRLELVVELAFSTADGELAERLPAVLSVFPGERAQLTAELALGAVQGSYDGSLDNLTGLRDPVLLFEGNHDAGGSFTGVIAAREPAGASEEKLSKVVATWRAEP